MYFINLPTFRLTTYTPSLPHPSDSDLRAHACSITSKTTLLIPTDSVNTAYRLAASRCRTAAVTAVATVALAVAAAVVDTVAVDIRTGTMMAADADTAHKTTIPMGKPKSLGDLTAFRQVQHFTYTYIPPTLQHWLTIIQTQRRQRLLEWRERLRRRRWLRRRLERVWWWPRRR